VAIARAPKTPKKGKHGKRDIPDFNDNYSGPQPFARLDICADCRTSLLLSKEKDTMEM
jgi:hypothetical protein